MDAVATSPEQPTAVNDGGSLADHEQAYHARIGGEAPAVDTSPAPPDAPAEPDAAADPAQADSERDDKGRFTKPRHRAKSQEASPEDVPRIRELTKRLREREAEIEALRQASGPYRQPDPTRAEPAQPAAERAPGFPSFDAWIAQKDNDGKSFEDFIDARAEWNYRRLRDAERADEARTASEREFRKHADAYASELTDAFYKEFPDFEDVTDGVSVSKVIERAVLEVGPRAAYYLGTHADLREELSNESLLAPDNPGFPAAVAAMKRYLKTLVAPEQRSSSPSRTAAVSTGSAPARPTVVAPRPPNPVRTAALSDGEHPPGDEGSLADHEKHFAPGRRRA